MHSKRLRIPETSLRNWLQPRSCKNIAGAPDSTSASTMTKVKELNTSNINHDYSTDSLPAFPRVQDLRNMIFKHRDLEETAGHGQSQHSRRHNRRISKNSPTKPMPDLDRRRYTVRSFACGLGKANLRGAHSREDDAHPRHQTIPSLVRMSNECAFDGQQ